MGNTDISNSATMQGRKADVGVPAFLLKSQGSMTGRVTSTPEHKILRQRVADRIAWLFDESGESPTEFAKRMGMKYNTFKAALEAKSFPIHRIVLLAKSLNVSMDFICGLTDNPNPASETQPTPDFWELQRRKQANTLKDKKAS